MSAQATPPELVVARLCARLSRRDFDQAATALSPRACPENAEAAEQKVAVGRGRSSRKPSAAGIVPDGDVPLPTIQFRSMVFSAVVFLLGFVHSVLGITALLSRQWMVVRGTSPTTYSLFSWAPNKQCTGAVCHDMRTALESQFCGRAEADVFARHRATLAMTAIAFCLLIAAGMGGAWTTKRLTELRLLFRKLQKDPDLYTRRQFRMHTEHPQLFRAKALAAEADERRQAGLSAITAEDLDGEDEVMEHSVSTDESDGERNKAKKSPTNNSNLRRFSAGAGSGPAAAFSSGDHHHPAGDDDSGRERNDDGPDAATSASMAFVRVRKSVGGAEYMSDAKLLYRTLKLRQYRLERSTQRLHELRASIRFNMRIVLFGTIAVLVAWPASVAGTSIFHDTETRWANCGKSVCDAFNSDNYTCGFGYGFATAVTATVFASLALVATLAQCVVVMGDFLVCDTAVSELADHHTQRLVHVGRRLGAMPSLSSKPSFSHGNAGTANGGPRRPSLGLALATVQHSPSGAVIESDADVASVGGGAYTPRGEGSQKRDSTAGPLGSGPSIQSPAAVQLYAPIPGAVSTSMGSLGGNGGSNNVSVMNPLYSSNPSGDDIGPGAGSGEDAKGPDDASRRGGGPPHTSLGMVDEEANAPQDRQDAAPSAGSASPKIAGDEVVGLGRVSTVDESAFEANA